MGTIALTSRCQKVKHTSFLRILLSSCCIVSTCALATAQSEGIAKDESSNQQQIGNAVVERLKSLSGSSTNKALVDESIAVVNLLLSTTRADQNSVHAFARTVNRNIEALDCRGTNEFDECESFKRKVRDTNATLLTSSYEDQLFQNRNLSEQIKSRLPLLIEDSLKFAQSSTRRDDFLYELEILSNRLLTSKRFRVGLGLGYSYLPSVSYQGNTSIDYSPFQSTISGGSDRLPFMTEFSNQSYASFAVSARIPFIEIDATFPTFSDSRTTLSPAQFRDIDSTDRDVLARSTILSELEVDYEVSVKLSLPDLLERTPFGRPNTQADFGIGAGLTGFAIQDTITTDVRFRTDDTSPFSALTTSEELTAKSKNNFNSPFAILYYAFDISDEFRSGVDVRWYLDTNSSNNTIAVEDLTVSVYVMWYPTFPWRK